MEGKNRQILGGKVSEKLSTVYFTIFCSASFPKMLVLTTWAYVAIILLYSGATVVNFSALVGNFNADSLPFLKGSAAVLTPHFHWVADLNPACTRALFQLLSRAEFSQTRVWSPSR